MRVRDKGPLLWLVWAFFSWRGRIKRIPYAVAFVLLVMLARLYVTIVAQTVAVYLFPPPGGAEIDLDYVRQLAASTHIVPFLIPAFYMYTVLDIKRLRSIGAPLVLSAVFAAISLLVPIFLPQFTEMSAMTVFAYHAILAVLPAKEDRMSPYERKYKLWQSLATGDGTPRRLSGKDIKHWHIVRQGPAK